MYAEESPWYHDGRSDVLGRVWFPDDDDTWYRYNEMQERVYRAPGESIIWAQGWRG